MTVWLGVGAANEILLLKSKNGICRECVVGRNLIEMIVERLPGF